MAGGWKLGTLLTYILWQVVQSRVESVLFTYILRQVVQSRVEPVLWQEDGS